MSHLGYNVSYNDHYIRHPSSSPVMHRAVVPSSGASTGGGPTPFRAPAHKHAHHLHSIPPREKSTRTLIIDHLLWVHARTRFAQARAELGMTDRTGGPGSSNHAHRARPENYEEEQEVYSDGEDVTHLQARAGGPGHTHGEEEDERFDMQDLTLARSLRQRAESVEKVATSMLDQPPEVPPIHPDELLDPPTSPQLRPQAPQRHPHKLPNGVRLRLALATVVNDLFSRKAPTPPVRTSSASSSAPPVSTFPSALIPLGTISSVANPDYHRPIPNQYIRSLYDIGADPDTQNSPPSLRCPRHLHMGCEICVEAKAPPPRMGQNRIRGGQGRAGSTTGSSPGDAPPSGVPGSNGLVGGVTGWLDGSGIGSGLARPGPKGTVLRRPTDAREAVYAINNEDGTPQMFNTKLAELIVRFMRISALVAMELGREATEDRASIDGGEARRDEEGSGGAGPSTSGSQTARPPSSPQTSLRTLTQRNLAEAGLYYYALRPSREWYFLFAGLITRAVFEGYMTAGWRSTEPLELLLGIGLGTSVEAGSRPQGAQRSRDTTTNGASRDNSDDDEDEEEEDEFKEFEPDDLPDLDEAARVLFPSLRDPVTGASGTLRREGAELEYELEMRDRLQRFYDVPPSTPDLATHMEDLQWQYPAEAVERAAVRFCEAIARWRGKPELETYKKAPWIVNQRERRASGTAMSIDALVHSNPTSPSNSHTTPPNRQLSAQQFKPEPRQRKPPIERYFTQPQSLIMQSRKRRRPSGEDRGDEGRRLPPAVFA
ncbi:hypothetical protein DAEQUDRAFT_812826 [Daedalea quercina L-15889]|uniref:Uncharacterized protein n=1 Tax=Daedalea quercina L-15889 TaxID=1314783 RepID=A0A165NVN0_9APHY|nr:hypothetical protein DAEQUDRAFT_812826 [Daedalea quercina L-15889]